MNSPTTRKRPQCHTCGNLMAGHKRQNGSPICPEPISPPSSRDSSPVRDLTPTPDWQRGRLARRFFAPSETPSLIRALEELPGGEVEQLPGGWRIRRNLNYERPNDPPSPAASLFGGGSIAPTEPERHPNHLAGGGDNGFYGYDIVPDFIMGPSKAVAAIYSTPPDDMDRIKNAAAKHGFFHGVIHNHPGTAHDGSHWVVLGRDARAVNYVLQVNVEEQGFGGGMGVERMYSRNPRPVTLMHLAVAGTLGGIVVAIGLSVL